MPGLRMKTLEDAYQDGRREAFLEIASWHQKRAEMLIKGRPGVSTAMAINTEQARADENQFAASYLLRLPDVGATLNDLSMVGHDSSTIASQLLYERPLGETNAQFLERAELLVSHAIDVAQTTALQRRPSVDAGLPSGWRLERIELHGVKEERFKATLWRQGGKEVSGYGGTPDKAVESATRLISPADGL